MAETVFIAKAKNGELDWGSDFNRARLHDHLKLNENRDYRLTRAKNPVSDQLRKYYFKVYIPTAKQAVKEWQTLSADEVHAILKKNFNGFTAFNPFTRRVERFSRSAMSNESNTERALWFMDKIATWLAEDYKIEIPSSKDYKELMDSARLISEE